MQKFLFGEFFYFSVVLILIKKAEKETMNEELK